MAHAGNPRFHVHSRHTGSPRIFAFWEELRAKVHTLIHGNKLMVSLTTDGWSLRVYHGYVFITSHWISKEWSMCAAILDLSGF